MPGRSAKENARANRADLQRQLDAVAAELGRVKDRLAVLETGAEEQGFILTHHSADLQRLLAMPELRGSICQADGCTEIRLPGSDWCPQHGPDPVDKAAIADQPDIEGPADS